MVNEWVPPIPGIIHVTGEPDTGKTTFAITVPGVQPGDIIFIDDDVKTRSVAKQFEQSGVKFGYYVDMKERCVREKIMKPVEFFNLVDRTILPEAEKAVKEARVLVWDNWSPRMEEAIRAKFLTEIEKRTDITAAQAKSMSMLTWTPNYEFYSQFLDRLLQIAPMVFIITHVKDKYLGMSKTGQLEARGQRPLVERPSFRVWTRHNADPADGGAPIGLVLKRISSYIVTPERGIQAVNVLPRRVKPLTWEKIAEYMHSPIGTRKLSTDENLTDFERSILDGELTPDQKDAIRVARVAAEHEDTIPSLDGEPAVDPTKLQVLAMSKEGKAPSDIAAALSLSVPEVLKFLM